MTNERAKSELEQLYMSLSEEKKKALDVAFKAMEQTDNLPVMYYPQVDGITPTVVAQADGEKTCGTCRNEDTYHCAECENKSDYEQSQADGEYISKSDVLDLIEDMTDQFGVEHRVITEGMISLLPSVAIPNKVGHWEYNQYDGNPNIGNWHCSECRNIVSDMPTCMGKPLYEFCPHCGSPMEIER